MSSHCFDKIPLQPTPYIAIHMLLLQWSSTTTLSFRDKRDVHKAMQETARQRQAKLEIVVIDKERSEVVYLMYTDDLTGRPRIYLTRLAFEAFETALTLAEAQHALTFLFLVISYDFGRLWPRTRSDAVKNVTQTKEGGDEIEIALCGGLVHLGIQKFTNAQGEEITSRRIEIRYPHLHEVYVLKDNDNEDLLKTLMGIRTNGHLGRLLLPLILADAHTVHLHSTGFRKMVEAATSLDRHIKGHFYPSDIFGVSSIKTTNP